LRCSIAWDLFSNVWKLASWYRSQL
jgi:hypothetical protein